ncbi:MAG: substrate-binding domain-containing protein, partial [Spirochaetales bacterium]
NLRHDGYKKALADAGLIFEKDNMIFLSLDKQDRFKTYERLYTTQKDFTALFFLADYYAAEAISFFQKNDIQIPEIFSVVGFDDNIYAKIVHPNITSVHQNTFERGKVAVDMLLKLIKGDSVEKNNLKMDITLKLRDSVKKIS